MLPDDVPGLGQVVETLESLGLESVVFQPAFSASDAVALTEILALRPSSDLDVGAELGIVEKSGAWFSRPAQARRKLR